MGIEEEFEEIFPRVILEHLKENGQGTEQGQVYGIAEEAGEFVGAMRRWRGMARRPGTEEEAKEELADVIISSYIMAEILGWSVEEIVRHKLDIVFSRGWKD